MKLKNGFFFLEKEQEAQANASHSEEKLQCKRKNYESRKKEPTMVEYETKKDNFE